MKQISQNMIIFFLLTMTLSTGCDTEPPKPQSVVINIRTIVDATGISEEIKNLTDAINQEYSEETRLLSAELGKDIEDKKASIGSNPSKEDEQKIQTLQKQQTKKFLEARKDINERRAKEISEIRQSYIDDILSMAQIIAHEHGAHIILKAVSIFWPDDSVDITDEVISRMMESKHASSVEGEQNITELNEQFMR